MSELTPSQRARIVEMVLAGEVGHARELCASLGAVLDMRGVTLTGASLRGVSLNRADLRGADLAGADLTEADLTDSHLIGADLRGATLEHATLGGAELVGADLRSASLRWVDLRSASLSVSALGDCRAGVEDASETRLHGADLRWSNLIDVDLSGVALDGADLRGALYSDGTRWPAGFAVPGGAFRCGGRAWSPVLSRHDVHVPGHGELAMRSAPAGPFWMGAAADAEGASGDERPGHPVRLSRGFRVCTTPVTQGLYALVVGHNPSYRKRSAHHPVEYLSWFDAVRFCNALSVLCGLGVAYTIDEGRRPVVSCDFSSPGFRLPTESEWEYAARAGQDFIYSGSSNVDEVAWHAGNSGDRTHPVGRRGPSAWGLYDMSGNVYEWCWDWYGRYRQDASVDPSGAVAGSDRVYRGGSWNSGSGFVRAAARNRCPPANSRGNLGLRVVMS